MDVSGEGIGGGGDGVDDERFVRRRGVAED